MRSEYEHSFRYITKTSSAQGLRFQERVPTCSVDPASLSRGALTNERVRPCVSLVIAPLQLRRRRRLRFLHWLSLQQRPVRTVTIIAAAATQPYSARWPACSAPS